LCLGAFVAETLRLKQAAIFLKWQKCC